MSSDSTAEAARSGAPPILSQKVNTSLLLLGLELQPPTIVAETRVVALDQRFRLFAGLRARGRQAGGGDGDDLGQPTPDPGRRAAQQ